MCCSFNHSFQLENIEEEKNHYQTAENLLKNVMFFLAKEFFRLEKQFSKRGSEVSRWTQSWCVVWRRTCASTPQPWTSSRGASRYITLVSIWFDLIQFRLIPLDYIRLHLIPFNSFRLHLIPFNSIEFHLIPFNYIWLHYIWFNSIWLN